MLHNNRKAKLQVEIWSDFACPYCFIGERRFEAALNRFEHKDEVSVQFRSFELNPNAPRIMDKDVWLTTAETHETDVEGAKKFWKEIRDLAATANLHYDIEHLQLVNTHDAHRLAHLADKYQKRGEVTDLLFQAHFEQGLSLTDTVVLKQIAAKAGLPEVEVEELLQGDNFTKDVKREHRAAEIMNIDYVPYFQVGDQNKVSGVVTEEQLLAFLQQVWDNLDSDGGVSIGGAACGIHGCE